MAATVKLSAEYRETTDRNGDQCIVLATYANGSFAGATIVARDDLQRGVRR